MKRKAHNNESTVKKAPSHLVDAKSVIQVGAPYLILSALVISLISILLYLLVVQGPSTQRSKSLIDITLRSYIDTIVMKLDTSKQFISEISKSPELLQAVVEKNSDEIRRIEKMVSRQMPFAVGAKVIFTDVLEQDLASTPKVTMVVLDLVRQLAKGKDILPEVISPSTSDQYIALLVPIKIKDKVVAALLLGVNRSIIDESLSRVGKGDNYVEIWQEFYENNHVIGKTGLAEYKISEPIGIGKSEGANWTVALWPRDVSSFSGQDELMYFVIAIVLMLVIVIVVNFMGIKKIQYLVRTDTGELAKMLIDSRGQIKEQVSAFQIDFFRDLILTLVRSQFSIGVKNDSQPSSAKGKKEVKSNDDEPATKKSLTSPLGSSDGLEVEDATIESSVEIPESIFRAYDIRGIVNQTLTPEIVREIGRSIGSEAFDRGEQKVVVARDGRLSGPELLEALKQGLMESGRDVVDIGEVPTPVLYFATNYLDTNSGVMVTGSHNPANYNGLKIVIAGETLSQSSITKLRERILKDDLVTGHGSQESVNIVPDYLGQITSDVALAQPLKVVVDCGNGVAGHIAPLLLEQLGCEVIEMYCDVDGNFPNHHPDPSKPENLKDLINKVRAEGADLGIAFDGDGDRLGVVDSKGEIIWPDRQMMLFAIDVLSRNPGADILFDVKCTRHLPKVIASHGGRPVMWKTGHSLMKAKMKETGALLAGECSGHIFFKERWFGFDDGLYSAARLLEILAGDVRKSSEVFLSLPNSLATPEINIPISDLRKFDFIKKLSNQGTFPGGKINTIDGIRVDFDNGWGLVRASNTSPCLVTRFEADSKEILEQIQDLFRKEILAVDNSIQLPF